MKRQRVGIACDKCRLLKAKCDGQQPECARCEGYGFRCSWSGRRRTTPRVGNAESTSDVGVESDRHRSPRSLGLDAGYLPVYRQAVQSYEALVKMFQPQFDGPQRAALDINLNSIRRQLPTNILGESSPTVFPECTPEDDNLESPTYVGKVSDIHFIHAVRQCMQDRNTLDADESGGQSYDQTPIAQSLTALGHPLQFPSREEAAKFLDIYLSTIHIAYPFLCKSAVLAEFQKLWTEDYEKLQCRPWLALFNFIFAIGSYYTSFPRDKEGDQRHYRYFEQGLFFSRELGATCTLTNVCVLLVQCVFLLAVCQTDRCWNTLGFAIRMGQSIGLHVESLSRHDSDVPRDAEREQRRRAWYSMYVLDRLLALQLGRPMAIHEMDFRVELPSQSDQWAFGAHRDYKAEEEKTTLSPALETDYFLQVIYFSHIVGLTIRELYEPTQIDLSADQMLYSTSSLDQHLAKWKYSLPRHLRFDLGHTFEKSITFKRQRNMLAVKFHHLRALIHRSFLCLPLLQVKNKPFMDLLLQEKPRIAQAEWICISEAQKTAHLLHNVVDERSLVHDFPWWQMISCLICASSILFVAETFSATNDLVERQTSAQSLREDAEMCLKVFEALSVNSAAARKAVGILKGLSQLKRPMGAPRHIPSASPPEPSTLTQQTSVASPAVPSVRYPVDLDLAPPIHPADLSADMLSCEWPSEISSAMEWSARFLDHSHRHAAYSPPNDEEI